MILKTLDDTDDLAARIVATLPKGSTLLLQGPLGAGKTTLVQRIAAATGSDAAVTSPTYTLVHEYPTPLGTLVHIDAYRLSDPESLFDLGLEDYRDRAWLVAIEWGGALRSHLPDAHLLDLEVRADGHRVATWVPPEVGARATPW